MAEETITAPALGEPQPETQTPAEPEAPSKPFHEMGKSERKDFLTKGTKPAPNTDDDADSSPAPSGEQADAHGVVKPKADSEPAKPEKKAAGKGVDKRKAELQSDIDEMNALLRTRSEVKRQLDALDRPKQAEKKTEAAAPVPSTEPGYKKYLKMPGAPKVAEFDGDLDEYSAAMSAFVAEQIAKETFDGQFSEKAKQSEAQATQTQALEAAITQSETRINVEKTADPTILERIDERFKALAPARFVPEGEAVGPHHYAKDLIMFESEHPLALSAFFSTDEGQAEFRRLMTLSPPAIAREIAYRDVQFRKPVAQVKAQPKQFTKAPEPSAKVEKKPGAVKDSAEAAVTSGNFRAFMAAMDEQEGVASRSRVRR